MDNAFKPVDQNFLSFHGYKLIMLLCLVIGVFIFNFATGKIPIDVFDKKFDNLVEYKLSWQEIYDRIWDLRDYFYTFGIMILITFFLARSNLEWEKKQMMDEENEGNGVKNLSIVK